MSHNELTQSAVEVGTQTPVSVASSLIDAGTVLSEEDLQSMSRSEVDALPERFPSDSPAKAVIKSGETDNAFVREQPW
jgi:hypothetical protein